MNDKFSNTNTKRNRSEARKICTEVMERKGDGQKKAESLISRSVNTWETACNSLTISAGGRGGWEGGGIGVGGGMGMEGGRGRGGRCLYVTISVRSRDRAADSQMWPSSSGPSLLVHVRQTYFTPTRQTYFTPTRQTYFTPTW
jgi:hypothetical protein